MIYSQTESQSNWFIKPLIRGAINYFKSTQNPDKGFPTDKEGSESCTWVTAGALWALISAGENFHSAYLREALDWLSSAQDRIQSGGIPMTSQRPNMPAADPTSTTAIVMAEACKQLNEPAVYGRLERLTRCLMSIRCKDRGWAMWQDEEKGTTINSSLALIGLTAAQEILQSPQVQSCIDETRQWIMEAHSEVGWGLYKNDHPKAVSTAFALLAMGKNWITTNQEASAQAISFLTSSQNDDGTWSDLIARHKGGTFIRFATPYCIMALIEAGKSLKFPVLRKSLKWLIHIFNEGKVRYKDTNIFTWPTRDCLLALSAIYYNLESKQVSELIEYNLDLEKRISEKEQEAKSLKEYLDRSAKEAEIQIAQEVQLKVDAAKRKFSLFKRLTIAFSLAFIGTIPVPFAIHFGWSISELATVEGPLIAIWGVIAYLIHQTKMK